MNKPTNTTYKERIAFRKKKKIAWPIERERRKNLIHKRDIEA